MPNNSLKKVDYSEWECLLLYNYIPRLIEKYAILVTISPNYYTSGIKEVLFTESPRGEYWIIINDKEICWLFPVAKKNHKINPRVSEIVRIVFDFHNYEYQDSQKAVIKKPAKVSSFTNGEGWILEEQGLIDFSGSSLLEIGSENSKFIQAKSPDIINDKLEEENSLLWLTRAEFDDYIHQFSEEIIRLKLQVKQINNSQQEMQLELKSINDLHSCLVTELLDKEEQDIFSKSEVDKFKNQVMSHQENPTIISNFINITTEEMQIVEAYNLNPIMISQQVKQVSETNLSIKNRLKGNSEFVVLEKQAQGYYWLIGRNQLYLMPRKYLNINRTTLESLIVFFEVQGSKAASKFKLIKPAKVLMIDNSHTWQLNEKGIIEFEL